MRIRKLTGNCAKWTSAASRHLACADYAFFPAYSAMLQFFSNLPNMLSDFPIMLRGFTYYAQNLKEKYTF